MNLNDQTKEMYMNGHCNQHFLTPSPQRRYVNLVYVKRKNIIEMLELEILVKGTRDFIVRGVYFKQGRRISKTLFEHKIANQVVVQDG